MLVHKGGKINNVQLITGLRQRMEVIVKMLKKREKIRGDGGGEGGGGESGGGGGGVRVDVNGEMKLFFFFGGGGGGVRVDVN